MHPELVSMVRSWISGLSPADKLFPKLAKRRTWLMVKKDLERVGIAYETADGIADFHAAGRHSHITGLMRSGATLPEAQKLARHTDIKQTMKYTHIGINDQAKAVSNLPLLHMCCIPGVAGSLSVSPSGTTIEPENEATPGDSEGCVVQCHPVAPGDIMEAAGIEPASRNISTLASTCVVDLFPRLAPPSPIDRVHRRQPGTCLTLDVPGVDPRRFGFSD
jgi:hypothetical protein